MEVMEYPLMTKRKKTKNKFPGDMGKRSQTVGADLHHLDVEKAMTFDTGVYTKRRALRLTKRNNSWGFTLQTYGIKHKKTNEIEVMTYIDYVDMDGAAWIAGLRRGDVILAVNGEKVGNLTHRELVNKIKQTGDILRLTVHFEDCCKKVDLHERFLKLKAVLRSKQQELREIEMQEIQILEKYYIDRGISRMDMMRQSMISSTSSNSDSWDAYSIISSPYMQKSTGPYGHWSSVSSIRSFNMEGSSIAEDEPISYIDSDSESISFTAGPLYSPMSDTDIATQAGNQTSHLITQNSRNSKSLESGLYKGDNSYDNHNSHHGADNQTIYQNDDVFIEDKGDNKQYFTASRADNSNLLTAGSQLRRNESTSSDKIYYKGENGKMIVPKICIEGDTEYTTFDDIDTQTDIDQLTFEGEGQWSNGLKPEFDKSPELLQEKIVAMEIAKEMNRIEKMVGRNEEFPSKTTKKQRKKIQKSKSQPLYKSSEVFMKNDRLKGLNMSPRLPRSDFTSHIGGSLSYDQLKSSVPDIVISFHAEDYQIIYINEGDQHTKL